MSSSYREDISHQNLKTYRKPKQDITTTSKTTPTFTKPEKGGV